MRSTFHRVVVSTATSTGRRKLTSQFHKQQQYSQHYRSDIAQIQFTFETIAFYHELLTPLHQQNIPPNNPTTANMSNSVQDQNMAESKTNDTPVEAPIEKGKGKAADDTMDDDEDDSESGEVSRASF